MPAIVIEEGPLRLQIWPHLAGGIADFSIQHDGTWCPLMRRAPAGAAWFNDLACYAMAPWTNRIPAGRFRWRGREHAVRPDWPDGTAIHGRVKDRAFRILDRSPVSARLEFDSRRDGPVDWPWAFRCELRYELGGASLRMGCTVQNVGEEPMPAGAGFHPFLARRLWSDGEDVRVRASLRGRYPAEGMIPTGPPDADDVVLQLAEGRALGSLELDDVFLGSLDGAAIEWPRSGVRARFECSENLGHAVVYTGRARDGAKVPLPYFCVEPVSMVNDGFNLADRGSRETGVVELGAGVGLDVNVALAFEGV